MDQSTIPTEGTPTPFDLSPWIRRQLLLNEAKRWIGIQEVGGNNRGQLVDIFLKTTGLPAGNPWCMAFVQFCIDHVDDMATLLNPKTAITGIFKSDHCMTVWQETPFALKGSIPLPGSVVIWEKRGSSSGHTGIVTSSDPNTATFKTIEGNTSPAAGTVEREGDGVYAKSHTLRGGATMDLVGFIYPWGK